MGQVSSEFAPNTAINRSNTSTSRRDPCDAYDVMFILTQYWEAIDVNRIVEQDMDLFVKQTANPQVKTAWRAIRNRYCM